MILKRPWRSLDVSGDQPLLFLKADADPQRCAIWVTDLNRLWGAALTRTDLVQSANDQATSIDPGEDDEQYEQFFNKVNSALEGDRKTSCKVQPGSSADVTQLSVSAPLPGSLPTFKWSIDLTRLDNDSGLAFESELITPLLAYTHGLRSQISQLIEEIGHKDRVISKITDKLETSGNDLTQVFPGVSNIRVHRKSSQRAQLASHINGLAEFDQHEWRLQAAKAVASSKPSIHDVNALLDDLPEGSLLSARGNSTEIWWHSKHPTNGVGKESDDGNQSRSRNNTSSRSKGSERSPPALHPAESSMGEDEFQRQTTPPNRKHQNGESHVNDSDDTDDEDDGDLDAPSQRASERGRTISQRDYTSSKTLPQSKDSSQSQGNKPSNPVANPRLGAISTRTATSPAVDPETASESAGDNQSISQASPQPSYSVIAAGSADMVDATPSVVHDDALETRDTEAHSGAVEQSPAKRKKAKRLGMVGGKKKRATPERSQDDLAEDADNAESTASAPADAIPGTIKSKRLGAFGKKESKAFATPHPSVEEQQSMQSPPKHVHHKLGNFSGRKSKSPPPAEQEQKDERRPRTAEREEEVGQEREDSEERANKKRERLKRELEEKTKAPVKKKRKF